MLSGGGGGWGTRTCVSGGQSLAPAGAPAKRIASTAASSHASAARRRAAVRRFPPSAAANICTLPLLAASPEIFAQDLVRGAQRQRRDGQRRIGGPGRGECAAADQE